MYAQIEKEALAIAFGCEKFEEYIYGIDFVVHSDHKLLETILTKSITKAPKRLQCIMLQLQPFTSNIEYIPGKQIVLADTLSRD